MLRAALRHDLTHYLTTRRKAEHISAVSLRVTYPGTKPAISLATGTTRYDGGPPVPASALWQVGSNTKAFTAVILLQLEAEGKLSINDPLGKWLPQYPAWRDVTIKQLLNMTSRIPNYALQPAFAAAIAADPATRFTAARLVSYAVGVPLAPKGFAYSDTNYILAQMIIERVTHDHLRRASSPGGSSSRCGCAACATRLTPAPRPTPPGCPPGTSSNAGAPPLLGKPMPRSRHDLGPGRRRHRQLTSRHDHLGTGPLPGPGTAATPAAPARKPRLRDHRQAHPPRPLPPTRTATRSASQQLTDKPIGTVWDYLGETLGYRVQHFYFPRTGLIIALAVNSAVDNNNDGLFSTAMSVYRTLQEAGAAQTG